MKVIYPNKINSISATKEDSDYPVSNLYDTHTTNIWKAATAATATLILQVTADSNAIALFRTNAISAELTFERGSNVIWEGGTRWGDNTQWDQSHVFGSLGTYSPDYVSQWIDYTSIASATDITISLSANVGETLEVGAVRAGHAYTFNDFRYGLGEDRRSTSVIKNLAYGHTYIKNEAQNIRELAGGLDVTRDSDFYTLLHTIAMQSGAEPLAWRLVTSLRNQDWVILAYIIPGGISGTHSLPLDSEMSLSLVEAI